MKTVLYFYENAFMMWRRRLEGIYAVARAEGWHVEAVDVGEQAKGVRPVLEYWKPTGVIVEGGVLRYKGCSADAFLDWPAVFYANTDVFGVPYFGISHNSENVVNKAVGELRMRRLASYGYVHYRAQTDWTMEREALFSRKMEARGQGVSVFKSWCHPKDEGSAAFCRRLEVFLAGLPKPCGILAANDEMAVQVLHVAQSLGIEVPEAMAVVGIDNDELICENSVPTLTSVSPGFVRSGKLAAGLLARCIRNPSLKPVVLEFNAAQVVRRCSSLKTERVDIRAVKAVEYVRANACKGITAADVVRQMGLKTRTAEYRFREVAKRSIREEIVAVRVAKAKELLQNSSLDVNDIYFRCGYRDPRPLRTVFTKATGCSLLQWRTEHR